jgi:hypothetical protein
MAREGMEYALGFVMKLAEAGVTFDQAEDFVFSKKAQSSTIEAKEPTVSRRAYDRIYRGTRARIRREADKSQMGNMSLIFQGLRNPITGKFRFPFSIGSKKYNTDISTMTPAQANMVSLLTKHRNIKDYRTIAKHINRGNPDFEFLGDPTVFNTRTGRLTARGMEDFKKAYKYVHNITPDDFIVNRMTNKLFGTTAGFDGSPYMFEQFQKRRI